MHRIRRLSAAVTVAAVLGVAAPAAASATSLVTISGATASYPLVSLLAAKYVKLHPGKIKFKITQGGAQVGINDVAAGRVSIADVSRDPIASDKGLGLDFYPVAKYAICTVTNKSNTLSNLTQSQLTAIFTGKVKTWSAVPGATATGNIDVITRTSVAGVLTSFKTLLLEGKSVESSATEESTEGLMKQQVESDPNSIGFLSNYQVELGGVNDVSFNGVACNKATANSGAYAGVAHFYEVTKGLAKGAASAFIGWIDSSAAAKKIISSQWIPIG
jgi:phosphate transport system substrate-binding protein